MSTREVITQYRIEQWAEIIKDRSVSGETIAEYCLRKGITKTAYYYWLRKLRKSACEQLAVRQSAQAEVSKQGFTEVMLSEPMLPDTNQLRIEVGAYKLTVGSGYSTEALVTLLRELGRLC